MPTATTSTPAPTIDEAGWERFRRHGFLRLGRVLDNAALAALSARIDAIMLGQVDVPGLMMQLDGGGAYDALPAQTAGFKGPRLDYRKIENLERDALFLTYLQHPLFRRIAAEIYGAHADIGCFRAMFMNKPAQKGTVLPWHQDGGDIWGLDRDPLVTVWTALDPATIANGCVQVISGSHRLGLLSKRGHTISPAHEADHCPADRVDFLELAAGEAVLLHNWLLHRSDVNRTERPRRAFSVCYLDARTRRRTNGDGFPVVFGDGALTAGLAAE